MKKSLSYALCAAAIAVIFSACSGINTLLKSGEPDKIYDKALEYYDKEKWTRASTLFEGAQHYYIGTPREDSIAFFNARCKYKNRDYDTASSQIRPQRLHRGCRRDVRHVLLLPLAGPHARPDDDRAGADRHQ